MLYEIDNDNSQVTLWFVAGCADELSPRPADSIVVDKAEGCELVLAGQLCIYVGRAWGDAAKEELKRVIDSRGGESAIDTGLRYLVSRGYDRARLDEMARLLSERLEGLRSMIFQLLQGV